MGCRNRRAPPAFYLKKRDIARQRHLRDPTASNGIKKSLALCDRPPRCVSLSISRGNDGVRFEAEKVHPCKTDLGDIPLQELPPPFDHLNFWSKESTSCRSCPRFFERCPDHGEQEYRITEGRGVYEKADAPVHPGASVYCFTHCTSHGILATTAATKTMRIHGGQTKPSLLRMINHPLGVLYQLCLVHNSGKYVLWPRLLS